MRIHGACTDPAAFPPWHFAEITIGKEQRVVALVHCEVDGRPVPFWYDDSRHPQRCLPLLRTMHPVCLGDYAGILRQSERMAIFVAVCKAMNDLPHPLLMVRIIQWIERRGLTLGDNTRIIVRQAISAAERGELARRRLLQGALQKLCNLRTT